MGSIKKPVILGTGSIVLLTLVLKFHKKTKIKK